MRILRFSTLCLTALAWCGIAAPPDATAADAAPLRLARAQGPGDDDPFADELNPLGGRRRPAPAQPAPATPAPAPEPALFDEAESEADRQEGEMEPPRPRERPSRPAPALKLPVPFPDANVPMPRRGGRPSADAADEERELSPAEEKLAAAEQLDMQGNLEGARALLREAIALDPKLTTAYLALGVVSRRLGDFEAAVEACSQGLLIDPENSELLLRRGIAWFHQGMYGIALEDFEDAAGIAYDDPRPELWRGLTLVELSRPLEAINAYASAIRRDRTYMLAYLNRGLAYLSTGEFRKAEFDFDHAIRHDPRDVRAWFNRGVAQARQGKMADAIRSYKAALRVDPQHEPARRNLAAAERMQAY